MQPYRQTPTSPLKDIEESMQNAHSQNEFAHRHIGPNDADVAAMLTSLGLTSLEELIAQTVPASILSTSLKGLKEPLCEAETLRELGKIAEKNQVFRSFIGQGYYDCFTPSVILRNVLENPAWYTSYTPYQPEISQGRLEALLNFQTMVCDLTRMEIANASMLDEATAAAEAMVMCLRLSKAKTGTFLVARDCLPQTIDVLHTRAEPLNIKIRVVEAQDELVKVLSASQDDDVFIGILLQYPGVDGEVRDFAKVVSLAHEKRAHVSVAADLLALTLLKPPGEWGADIVVGSAQRFGVPMGYGGPHAAYLATRDTFKREMPGRLVGVSVDSHGNPANRLALQTREQHIRREKATSNICTAQALLAIMASFYAVYHGPTGLSKIAKRVHDLTTILASGLKSLGYKVVTREFFDTLLVACGKRTFLIHQDAHLEKINLRVVDDEHLGISLDETTGVREVQQLLSLFARHAPTSVDVSSLVKTTSFVGNSFADNLARTSAFLTHAVFNLYHSETEMMRYLRALADRDLALDRTMIPLGSCTMKLNAATEMMPVSWPAFANMHPFAPAWQAMGYQELAHDLEKMLCECTGYDAVSLQPNSGAQGEYAGLLAIRAYHATRKEAHRNICLIPASAHGTNPASAHMAGMQVVVVACDAKGNVDVVDLTKKATAHREHLAAMMITYPSTHGVFEAHVRQMCDIVHANGGQVYIDGANLNAQVGLAKPGEYGGDVSHLNLHKTFCIPHGGGGPGVGPIGVKSHLAPFLPGRRLVQGGGIVSAAALGSAGILPISWSYIRMMGAPGLRRASTIAILNANYIAMRLSPHYSILYTDEKGRVAHECIIDLRPITQKTGITGEDVAKRLIDFGFHAPTMSFPVPGTLMVEPTESESLAELDRFCQAMLKISEEIADVECGKFDAGDNPLKNAPHTAESLVGEWHHAYSRAQAVFPVDSLRRHKYWPPVGRIDNVYGDKNLFCTCLPMSEMEVSPS